MLNNEFGVYLNNTNMNISIDEKLINLKNVTQNFKIKISKYQQSLLDKLCKKDCHQYYFKIMGEPSKYTYFYTLSIYDNNLQSHRIIYSPKLTLVDYCLHWVVYYQCIMVSVSTLYLKV